MTTFTPRTGTSDDADEIVRLACVMWDAMGYAADVDDGPWRVAALGALQTRSGPTFRTVVVDHPEAPGELIACGIGVIHERMPAFWNPNGLQGYVQWVSVEPAFRRQGLGRAVTEALLAWFAASDVLRVEMHATPDGDALYRQLGFDNPTYPNLWWQAP